MGHRPPVQGHPLPGRGSGGDPTLPNGSGRRPASADRPSSTRTHPGAATGVARRPVAARPVLTHPAANNADALDALSNKGSTVTNTDTHTAVSTGAAAPAPTASGTPPAPPTLAPAVPR
jgi:hypothetical protein